MDLSDVLLMDLNAISPDEAKLHLKIITAYDESNPYYNRYSPLHDHAVRAVGRLEQRAAIDPIRQDGTPLAASHVENSVISDGHYQNLLGDSRVVLLPGGYSTTAPIEKQDGEGFEIHSLGGSFTGSQGGIPQSNNFERARK